MNDDKKIIRDIELRGELQKQWLEIEEPEQWAGWKAVAIIGIVATIIEAVVIWAKGCGV